MGPGRTGHFRPPAVWAPTSPSAGDFRPGWPTWAQAEQATAGRLRCGQLQALQPATSSQAGQRRPGQTRPLQAAYIAGDFKPFSRRLEARLANVGPSRTGHLRPPAMRATSSPSAGDFRPGWPTWAQAEQATAGRLRCGQLQALLPATSSRAGQRRPGQTRPLQAACIAGNFKALSPATTSQAGQCRPGQSWPQRAAC